MPRHPPWTITVGRKQNVIAEFTVPAHNLQRKAREAFLRALVARYSTDTPQEMLHYYANRTRGYPPIPDVRWNPQPDRLQNGYFFGDWECYASAMYEIRQAEADWIKRELNRGK